MVARRAAGAARGIQPRLAHARDAVSVPGCVCAVAEDADTHYVERCRYRRLRPRPRRQQWEHMSEMELHERRVDRMLVERPS
eukprot:scaffold133035_cov78-Phaeocystis_antarctica.AAC.1